MQQGPAEQERPVDEEKRQGISCATLEPMSERDTSRPAAA